MFSLDLVRLPSFMNNMAQGVLKRLSTAVGYNMTCDSQEKVEKHLPVYDLNTEKQPIQKPLHERGIIDGGEVLQPLCDIEKVEEYKTDVASSKIIAAGKENAQPRITFWPTKSEARNIPLKSRGKITPRNQFRAEYQRTQKQHRREIIRKMREGEARRKSWSPDQILKNRWAKMSQKQRNDMVDRLDRLIRTGAGKTRDWLVWNVPKYTTTTLHLILAGEMPEYASDAVKMCDLLRDMDKL